METNKKSEWQTQLWKMLAGTVQYPPMVVLRLAGSALRLAAGGRVGPEFREAAMNVLRRLWAGDVVSVLILNRDAIAGLGEALPRALHRGAEALVPLIRERDELESVVVAAEAWADRRGIALPDAVEWRRDLAKLDQSFNGSDGAVLETELCLSDDTVLVELAEAEPAHWWLWPVPIPVDRPDPASERWLMALVRAAVGWKP